MVVPAVALAGKLVKVIVLAAELKNVTFLLARPAAALLTIILPQVVASPMVKVLAVAQAR